MSALELHGARTARIPHELVARYHWKRLGRIRAGRRTRRILDHGLRFLCVGGYRIIKRAMDIAGALALVLLLLPVFVLVAIAIRLTDGGNVFFRQSRIGLHGKVFACPKFRSMVPNADRIILSVAG